LFLDFTFEFVGKVGVFFLPGRLSALVEEVVVAGTVRIGRAKV